MKSKKRVSFQDDGEKQQKQKSRTKKKHLLKKEPHMINGQPGGKFKKPKKMKGKPFDENDSGLKTRGWKKSGKKSVPGKAPFGKSNKSKSKFQKKVSPTKGATKKPLNENKAEKTTTEKKSLKRKASELGEENKKEDGPKKKMKLCEMKPKQRKLFRKKQKAAAVFDMSVASKKIWEVIRRDDCSEDKRKNLIAELMNLIKGHIKQLIFAHDTVRVIECIVAMGSPEQRAQIFDEVKGDIVFISKSKYGKHYLIKVFSYGTKEQKDFVVNSLKGHVVSLVKHSEAAHVVETAFNEYANAKQRAEMIQEFYGPTFAVFKDEDARNLDDILLKHPDQKGSILAHIKDILLKITEKSVIRHSIVHHVLREFLNHADVQSRTELIENIRDAVAEILHTKDGARVAMNCIWHGTAKDRKKIVKSMKMHITKVAKEEHGSLALIAIFDCVDDVKLIQQTIITKLCENFSELAEDKHARKVFLYMLCPRDSHFFHPDVVNILKAGDENEHSKKSPEQKRQEIKDAASAPLLKVANEHLHMLVKTNPTCLFLLGILQHATGDKKEILENISSFLLTPYQHKTSNDLHPLEQPSLHFLIKKLLQNEASKQTDEIRFSEVLTTSVPVSVMKSWIECNRGAFILLDLLKCGVPLVVDKVLQVTKGLHAALKAKSYKGAELLLTELKKHNAH